MSVMRPPPRRYTTIALLVVAGLCLALVALALWNPGRLTALHPLAATGGALATLTFAGALVATTALLMLFDSPRGTGRPALIGLVVALVAIPALCVGLPVAALGDAFRDRRISGERVLATSPAGGYSAVAVAYPGGSVELFLRSRRGLLSQQAATPVARCGHDPFAVDLPPESVHFTDEHRIAVPVVAEGVTVTVAFHGETLRPERTIDMCEE
jgi:hypothetical protein